MEGPPLEALTHEVNTPPVMLGRRVACGVILPRKFVSWFLAWYDVDMILDILIATLVMTPSGKFLTQIDGFLEPSHAIWLPDGNIAVADKMADEIVIVTPEGKRVSTEIDVDSPIYLRLDEAGELTHTSGYYHDLGFLKWPDWFDGEKQLNGIGVQTKTGWVIPDKNDHSIQHFDMEGNLLGKWGTHALLPHEGNGKLHYPNAVDVSPDGTKIVVCEGFEGRIQIFTLGEGEPERAPLISNIAHFGKQVDSYGDLIILAEPELGDVYLFRTGLDVPIPLTRFGGEGNAPHQFKWIHGLWIQDGEIKVVGKGNVKSFMYEHDPESQMKMIPGMVKFKELESREFYGAIDVNSEGQTLLSPFGVRDIAFANDMQSWWSTEPYGEEVWQRSIQDGGNDGLQKLSGFIEPSGIEIEKNGNILVSDIGASNIKRFSPDGELLLTFGEKGFLPHQMFKPAGITVLDDGTIVVVDWGNHRAQLYSTDGAWQATFGRGRSWTREKNPPPHSVTSNAGNWTVTFSPTPDEMPLNEVFEIVTWVKGDHAIKFLRVDAAMPAHGHGMMTDPVTTLQEDGSFKTTGMLLSMPGFWEIYFDIDDGKTIERAQDQVTLAP
ncbi:MAG: hypothetical protein ACI9JK_001166 [Phycisphaerales bacterium]